MFKIGSASHPKAPLQPITQIERRGGGSTVFSEVVLGSATIGQRSGGGGRRSGDMSFAKAKPVEKPAEKAAAKNPADACSGIDFNDRLTSYAGHGLFRGHAKD